MRERSLAGRTNNDRVKNPNDRSEGNEENGENLGRNLLNLGQA
uniref:Uncharacterized protein n=1 Tax=Manihot esculenta TaxID=3983 RepID=A0A2C9UQF1_MANES